MKTILRGVRMKLLDEGKLARYLTYAVGEVVLIIVGILFALRISDWNEDRKTEAEFEIYVMQLRNDVQTAIDNVNHSISIIERFASASAEIIPFLERPNHNRKDLSTINRLGNRIDLSVTNLNKFVGRGNKDYGFSLKYDLEELRASNEFIHGAQQTINMIAATGMFSEKIAVSLEAFLAVLEEY